MKLIIDISEDVYTRLFDNGIQDNEIAADDICEMARALRRGKPLPQDATNGDVIKAMFPNAKTERGLYGISGIPLICVNLNISTECSEMVFTDDW